MVETATTNNQILQEKATQNGFDNAIGRLHTTNELESALATILISIRGVKCGFCHGLGHTSNVCQSKKNVDHAVKNAPGLRILWGTLKGIYRSTGKRTSAVSRGASKLETEQQAVASARSRTATESSGAGSM